MRWEHKKNIITKTIEELNIQNKLDREDPKWIGVSQNWIVIGERIGCHTWRSVIKNMIRYSNETGLTIYWESDKGKLYWDRA
jgi:hypothetical protein